MTAGSDKTACDRFERCLDAYLGDALASREREAARRHASSCPECLSKLRRGDDLALFLPLSQETPSPRVTEGFWDAVRAGIEGGQPGAAEPVRRRLPAWSAVPGRGVTPFALAASILVMVLAAYMAAVAPGRIGPAADPAGPQVSVSSRPLPQTVEQVRTDDARDVQVYSMTWLDQKTAAAGNEQGSVTELILIVDAGLKL